MRNFIYRALKLSIKFSLYAYYKRIEVHGLEHIPKNKPVLFLPNHQNALLDVLLIVVDCNRKPYFLTRSDVFGTPVLNSIFKFLRMIPIYRIRDGRGSLSKNDAIFNECAHLLSKGEAMVMFPEANHNLERRVRPLSKGFTRILFRTTEKYPNTDIQLIPVGLNYKGAKYFPDEVSLYYGEAISFKDIYNKTDLSASTNTIKQKVTDSLQKLTTHIPFEKNYKTLIAALDKQEVNYLRPKDVNKIVDEIDSQELVRDNGHTPKKKHSILHALFVLINFPILMLWCLIVKPKVWEPEFMATLRFATALLGFAIYYSGLFIAIAVLFNYKYALIVILGIISFNWIYVKYSKPRFK